MMHATSRVGQCRLLIQIFSLAFLILPSVCQPLRIPWKPCTEGGKASICLSPEWLNRAHSSSLSAHLGVGGWVCFYLDLARSRNGLRLKKKLIEIRKLEEKDGLGLMWRKWIDLILGMWSVKFQKSFSWRCLKWCRKEIWPQEDPSGCIAVSSLPSLSYSCFFWRLLFVYLVLPHLLCVFLNH